MDRDIGASELENWTLRDLAEALEGSSLAAEEALSGGVGGGELLGTEWKERVAMMRLQREKVKHRWGFADWLGLIELCGDFCRGLAMQDPLDRLGLALLGSALGLASRPFTRIILR